MQKRLIYLTAALLLVFSCQSEIQELNVNQEKYIDDYIKLKFADSTVVHIDGVSRVLIRDNPYPAPELEKGDSVSILFAGYTFGASGPGALFTMDSCTVKYGSGELIHGLDTGLRGVRQGQELVVMFPSKYGYGNRKVGIVPENTALLFNLVVAGIKKKE